MKERHWTVGQVPTCFETGLAACGLTKLHLRNACKTKLPAGPIQTTRNDLFTNWLIALHSGQVSCTLCV